jgi:hypothetical protein
MNNGESDVIFDKGKQIIYREQSPQAEQSPTLFCYFQGPLKLEASCYENIVAMSMTLFNPNEDMLVYGDVGWVDDLNDYPIGNSTFQVLDKGVNYYSPIWIVVASGNDIDDGAVKILTLKTHQSYYVGWNGESFIGIANSDVVNGTNTTVGLEGGGDCALTGVFDVVFPEEHRSKAGK